MCTPVSWSKCGPNLDLLGSFGFIWVEDNMPGRISRTLTFRVLQVKKFKFRNVEIWGMNVEMAPYMRKYKILVKEVY